MQDLGEPWKTLSIDPKGSFAEPGSAVNRENLSGDEAGVVGCEVCDCVRDVFRFPPALQRNALSYPSDCFRCVPELLGGAGRFDRTWRDRVDADVVAGPFN